MLIFNRKLPHDIYTTHLNGVKMGPFFRETDKSKEFTIVKKNWNALEIAEAICHGSKMG